MTAQPITRPPSPRRIRIVQTQRRPRTRVGVWMVSSLLIALVFFGLIYSHTRLNASAIHLQQVEAEIDRELVAMEALQLEVARLESPARVAPAAEKLGMVFPAEMRTLSAPGVVVQTDEEVERLADLKAALGTTP